MLTNSLLKAVKPVSPEWEILLCCSRTQLEPSHRDRLQTLLHMDLDWPRLLHLANHHHVLPLLSWQLTQPTSPLIPDHIWQHLQITFRNNLDRNLSLTTELLKLVKHFTAAKIPLLSFKGPILAQIAYGHLGLRQFLDLDILVPEAHALGAIALLTQQGYQPQFDLTLWQQKTYVQLRNALSFWHEARQVAVDLHWELLPKGYSFCPAPEQVWQDCQTMTIAGKTALTFSSENLFLFLCIHGAKHDWSRLYWVSDIAELLRRSPDFNWDRVQSQLGKFGTHNMVWLGLSLAHDLFDVSLPQEMLIQLKTQSHLSRLKTQIQSQLQQANVTKALNPVSWQSIYRSTINSPIDKLWYWLDAILTPTPLDWSLISLPQWLFFSYYPIRALRLIVKYSSSILVYFFSVLLNIPESISNRGTMIVPNASPESKSLKD